MRALTALLVLFFFGPAYANDFAKYIYDVPSIDDTVAVASQAASFPATVDPKKIAQQRALQQELVKSPEGYRRVTIIFRSGSTPREIQLYSRKLTGSADDFSIGAGDHLIIDGEKFERGNYRVAKIKRSISKAAVDKCVTNSAGAVLPTVYFAHCLLGGWQ